MNWAGMTELLDECESTISIYMPIDPELRDPRLPGARLRQLIDSASERLASGSTNGHSESAVDRAWQFAAALDFSRHRPAGIALLFTDEQMRAFALPAACEEQIVVG